MFIGFNTMLTFDFGYLFRRRVYVDVDLELGLPRYSSQDELDCLV